MSGEDNFLARWSQRKREAKRAEPERDLDPALEDVADAGKSSPSAGAHPVEQAEEAFDLESLPKLDDLTASTDIRAFLQKGVPEDLRNAALRKAWALDPMIRDYVSPALEYAYDWNVPGGVPGNGDLAPGTDIAGMVARVFGSSPETSALQNAANVIEHVAPQPTEQQLARDSVSLSSRADQTTLSAQEAAKSVEDATPVEGQPAAATGKLDDDTSFAVQQKPRRHGGAMPHV